MFLCYIAEILLNNTVYIMHKKHYCWLDLLRFLSALWVVLAHCRANFFEIYAHLDRGSQNFSTKIFYFITSFSDDAVLLFFILSGFLVGGQTLEKLINRQDVSAREFAMSRMIRICFPLFASVLLIPVVDLVLGVEPSWKGVFYNLLSLQNIRTEYVGMGGPLWTMPYIVWSYFLLYAFILLSKTSTREIVLGTIVLSVVLGVFTLSDGGGGTYKFLLIFLGVLAYVISKYDLPNFFSFISVIVVLITAVLTKFAKPSISREASFLSDLSVPLLQVLETVFLAVLVGQIVRKVPVGKFAQWLNDKSARVSVFSYSLYLIHFQVIRLMGWAGFPKARSVDLGSVSLFAIEVCICIFFGYIFYLCVEKHTLRLRNIANHILFRNK